MNEFSYSELFTALGLSRFDATFLRRLGEQDGELATRLGAYRAGGEEFVGRVQSNLLLRLAPWVERFIGELFAIDAEVAEFCLLYTSPSPRD